MPTEARVEQKKREKERTEQGKEPKQRKTTIEDHRDDCGDSLKGLGHDDSDID